MLQGHKNRRESHTEYERHMDKAIIHRGLLHVWVDSNATELEYNS